MTGVQTCALPISIEKEFGRTLSPTEYEIIKAWLDNNISEDIIKEALKEAVFNGVSNLRYIDKILYEWKKLGIETVEDVERNRKKHLEKKNDNKNIDMDIVDWNWFEDEGESADHALQRWRCHRRWQFFF